MFWPYLQKTKDNYTYWYCSVRNKKIRCRATVTQSGDSFRRGIHGHSHAADPGAANRVKVSAKVGIANGAASYTRIRISNICSYSFFFFIGEGDS